MAEKKLTLSVAIAVYNEGKNIEACLSSVASLADEITVVDGGSTDNTLALVKKFHARVIETDNPEMFHINKQKALDGCHSDWILQMDADEVITEELKKEILSVIQASSIDGYFIARRNYFWGHFMKKGGQYPDYVIRLVRRGRAHFPCKSVHEQIQVDGEVGHLTYPMLHFSYRNRSEYWKKADAYTSLTARSLKDNKEAGIVKFFQYSVIKPVYTFLSLYIRHKGFVDGLTGFEFALYSALHYPIAYKKFLTS